MIVDFFCNFTFNNKTGIVPGASQIKRKSFRKAVMLLGVYALHLVFFQALMQAAPVYNVDNSFKTLFSPNPQNQATHSVPAAKHPAVTYYTILVKQGNNLGTNCENVTPALQPAQSVVTPNVLSALFNISQTSIGQLHLADDIFKVYRLIHVLLI